MGKHNEDHEHDASYVSVLLFHILSGTVYIAFTIFCCYDSEVQMIVNANYMERIDI